MKRRFFPKVLVLASLASSIAGSASADLFTDRTLFEAALGMPLLEDFESFPALTDPTDDGVDAFSFPGAEVLADFEMIKVLDAPFMDADNTTPGGSHYLYLDTDPDAGPIGSLASFEFDSLLGAVGFDYTGLEELTALPQVGIELINGDFLEFDLDLNLGSPAFWGYTSTVPIASLLVFTDLDFGIGIDQFTFEAAPVPEPSTLLILGLGLAGLVVRRTIRR